MTRAHSYMTEESELVLRDEATMCFSLTIWDCRLLHMRRAALSMRLARTPRIAMPFIDDQQDTSIPGVIWQEQTSVYFLNSSVYIQN